MSGLSTNGYTTQPCNANRTQGKNETCPVDVPLFSGPPRRNLGWALKDEWEM